MEITYYVMLNEESPVSYAKVQLSFHYTGLSTSENS